MRLRRRPPFPHPFLPPVPPPPLGVDSRALLLSRTYVQDRWFNPTVAQALPGPSRPCAQGFGADDRDRLFQQRRDVKAQAPVRPNQGNRARPRCCSALSALNLVVPPGYDSPLSRRWAPRPGLTRPPGPVSPGDPRPRAGNAGPAFAPNQPTTGPPTVRLEGWPKTPAFAPVPEQALYTFTEWRGMRGVFGPATKTPWVPRPTPAPQRPPREAPIAAEIHAALPFCPSLVFAFPRHTSPPTVLHRGTLLKIPLPPCRFSVLPLPPPQPANGPLHHWTPPRKTENRPPTPDPFTPRRPIPSARPTCPPGFFDNHKPAPAELIAELRGKLSPSPPSPRRPPPLENR